MKYIIVSSEKCKGVVGDDSPLLQEYFELGWEVATTHYDVKLLLTQGIVSKDDIIVTHSGREFMYEKLFTNVITYSKYFEVVNSDDIILDLVQNTINYHLKNAGDMTLIGRNILNVDKNSKLDKEILCSFNYNDNIIPTKEYACLHYRKRNHCSCRNINDSYFNRIIDIQLEQGMDIYILGYGAEKFDNGKNIFYVDLRDWATLIHNDKCKYIFATLSGPANLINYCATTHSKIDILCNTKREDGSNLIICGDELNVNNLKINFI